MSMIEVPRNGYSSAEDFRSRTLAGNDRDAVPYPDDNETLRWMMEEARHWSKLYRHPRVLEVGCGHGRWAKHLERFYSTYIGVDPVLERIESACRLFGSQSADFMFEPSPLLRDAAVYRNPHVVFAVDVLQHLGLNEAIELVGRIAAILPLGGRFVAWDGCIRDCTTAEAEREYAESRPEHMIPKPLSAFQSSVPSLRWTLAEGTRFVAVKG